MVFGYPHAHYPTYILTSFGAEFFGNLGLLASILVFASFLRFSFGVFGPPFLCGMSFFDVGFSLGSTTKTSQTNQCVSVTSGCCDFNYFISGVFMSRRALNWSGSLSWLAQRFSVLGIILFFGLFVDGLLTASSDYAQWHQWWSHPVVRFLFLLGGVALLIHQWVGIRDILMDYVHPDNGRRLAYGVVVFVLLLELIGLFILSSGATI